MNVRTRWDSAEGSPYPLGVSWVASERAYNFALYSKHAESVTLLVFRADDLLHPALTYELDCLINKSGPIWHCRVSAADLERAA